MRLAVLEEAAEGVRTGLSVVVVLNSGLIVDALKNSIRILCGIISTGTVLYHNGNIDQGFVLINGKVNGIRHRVIILIQTDLIHLFMELVHIQLNVVIDVEIRFFCLTGIRLNDVALGTST